MTHNEEWFTEICEEAGTAYSLKIVEKLQSEQSPFQKIDIYQTTDWGRLMAIDGYTMVTTRDNFLYHEMMSHPVLFTHDNPRHVAIIGGGDCGTLGVTWRSLVMATTRAMWAGVSWEGGESWGGMTGEGVGGATWDVGVVVGAPVVVDAGVPVVVGGIKGGRNFEGYLRRMIFGAGAAVPI